MTSSAEALAAPPVRIFDCAGCRRTYVADGEACGLCGRPTSEVTGEGRGRLTTWTTVSATPPGVDPYVIGWAELEGAEIGVLGRFVGDPSSLRAGLAVRVGQTDGPDGWARLWLVPDGI